MKKINLIFMILTIIATSSLFGQSDRNGTAGATELLIPVGGRGVAMGNANLTNSVGVDAIFWNPANIARSNNSVDVMVSHMNYIADIGVQFGAVGVNFEEFGSIAFSIKSLSVGDIIKTTVENPDGTGQTFAPQYSTIGLSYSKMLSDRVSVGLNLNYINETIDLVSASGFGFDVGVTYADLAGINGFDMAVILKNIGSDMSFDGSGLWIQAVNAQQRRDEQFYKIEAASFSLPTTLDIGLGYTLSIDAQNNLNFVGTFVNHNYYTDQYKVGAEYSYDNLLFFRGGYNHTTEFEASETLYKFSAGFGINYNLSGVGVQIDYAYLPTEFFDDTHLISLSLGIE